MGQIDIYFRFGLIFLINIRATSLLPKLVASFISKRCDPYRRILKVSEKEL